MHSMIQVSDIPSLSNADLTRELAFAEGFAPPVDEGGRTWLEGLRAEDRRRKNIAALLVDFHHRAEGLSPAERDALADFTVQRILGTYDYAETFETPYVGMGDLGGKPFEVVRVIEIANDTIDQESTPHFIVRIDGQEVEALPEEVLASRWTGYPKGKR